MLMQSHSPVREKAAADQPWIEGLLRERWGGTVVVVHGARFDAAALPALVAGDRQGLATYCIDGEGELVTLDALRPRRGVGTALLGELVRRLSASGISTLRVTTTNDNLDALRFYQRRGFRLVRLRCGALEESRRLKPAIPASGAYGIPLRDEIELRLDLSSSDWFQSCKPQVRQA